MPVPPEGEVQEVRRSGDPENVDFTAQRDRYVDWQTLAPRWLLIVVIALLIGLVGWMGGKNAHLEDERLQLIQKHASDQRWDMLARLAETQAVQGAQIRQHDEQLRQLSKLADDISDIRADVRALKRLAERR